MPYADKRKEKQSKHDRYEFIKQNPEFIAERKKYRDEHADRNREYQRIYRLEHKDQLDELKKRRKHLWRSSQKSYQSEYGRQYVRKLREQVIATYGGRCECCGETAYEFLTVDHTNGDGAKHRKECGAGHTFYRWLVKAGCPREGFRLLCWNCNLSRGRYGFCPHEREKSLPKVVNPG